MDDERAAKFGPGISFPAVPPDDSLDGDRSPRLLHEISRKAWTVHLARACWPAAAGRRARRNWSGASAAFAAAISSSRGPSPLAPDDHLYIVDWTARIQAFDRDGKFLGVSWTPPDFRNGRPSGLSVDSEGNVVVSDSHYHTRARLFPARGIAQAPSAARAGTEPGQLGYVSDALCDKAGNFYVAEFGENQRISKFDADGKFVKCWGSPGGRARPVRPHPRHDASAPTAISTSPTRATTASRSSRPTVNSSAPSARRAAGQANSSYPYDVAIRRRGERRILRGRVWQWPRAEIHPRRPIARHLGQRRAARRGNCAARGRWRSIAAGAFTWSIA